MKFWRPSCSIRQEAKLCLEAELRWSKVDTTEEGEGSGTGESDEEEARDKDNIDERTTASGEEINGPGKYTDRDDNVSDGDEDIDWDAIRGGSGSETDRLDSGGRYGDEDKESLEVEDMEEAA